MSTSIKTSDFIEQAIVKESFNYEKVITDVAVGLQRSNFFRKANWKSLLDRCFADTIATNERPRSSEDSFITGLSLATGSTPQAPNRNNGYQLKRTCTAENGLPTKKVKVSTPLKKLLSDLKSTNWPVLTEAANAEQAAVEHVTLFERSKQNNSINNAPAEDANAVQLSLEDAPLATRRQTRSLSESSVRSRRVGNHQVQKPHLTSVTRSDNAVDTVSKTKNTNVVPSNITIRRTTRKHSQLEAAYSGSISSQSLRLQSSLVFQRTTLLFTLTDVSLYKDVLKKFNIMVADKDEQYDYLITENICRSPKFLAAVVCGKPIISTGWLHALRNSAVWLNPLNYLLKDQKSELQYKFKLADTLLAATNQRLFVNYSILVTPNTKITPACLKGIIFSGGGKFMNLRMVPRKGDEVICVSDIKDKAMWSKAKWKYPKLKKIISIEGFTHMILQYSHDVSGKHILSQF